MKVYFTSDLHLGMPGILEVTNRHKRFKSIEEHDDFLLRKINETVQLEDRLYILGDIGSKHGIERLKNEVQCKDVRIVFGNHDIGNKSVQWFRHNFVEAEHLLEYRTANNRFVLSHYPMLVWNQSFRGSINLFGHCHNNIFMYDQIFRTLSRSLDIGLDSACYCLHDYRPFELEDILLFTVNNLGYSPDAHRATIKSAKQLDNNIWEISLNFDFDTNFLPNVYTRIYHQASGFLNVLACFTDHILVRPDAPNDMWIKVGDEIIWG